MASNIHLCDKHNCKKYSDFTITLFLNFNASLAVYYCTNKNKERHTTEHSHFASYLHFKNSVTALSVSSMLIPCFFLWDIQNTNSENTAESTAGDSNI